MKMFRPLIGLALAILFLFTCVPTVSAASDSKKKDKKEESSSKKKDKNKDKKKDKSKKEDSGEEKKKDEKSGPVLDKNNPYYSDLKRLERYQEELAATSSANKKKKYNQKIKKLQAELKSRHEREVAQLKRRIHNYELRLKTVNHKTFRENIEKQIAATKERIEKLNAWAGIEKKDAKDAKDAKNGKDAKAPAAKGGDDAPGDVPGMDM